MKTSTVLKKARSVLVQKGWCQESLAKNRYRHDVDPTNPNAVKFCAYGAIHHVLGLKDNQFFTNEVAVKAERYLKDALPTDVLWYSSVTLYNDRSSTTIQDVDSWFKRAIKLAKKDETV